MRNNADHDAADPSRLATFDQYRGILFSIAYRMVGSVADAEDLLQDTFLRWQGVQVLIAAASRPFAPTTGVRRLWEERLATAWAWEGTHARTMRLLTLDA